MKAGGYILGSAALVLLSAAWFYVQGSVVVSGETNNVKSVEIANSVRSQKLIRLPGGIFFAFPRKEGGIRVVCRNGAEVTGGYTTPHLHSGLLVKTDGACVTLANN